MGDDPHKSVVNRFNQVHDARNVFVTDGACFVTQGCYEPTLTIMAISARAGRLHRRRIEEREPVMEPDEVTRRLWLLRIGSGAALTGLSGLDLPAAAGPPLPAGLYQPSADHLAHVLKAAAVVETPPAPIFFTAAEYQQLTRLIGGMLGEDPSTPPVPEIAAWIDRLVHDAAAVREAARSLSPDHRALAIGFYGEEAVRELETFDAQQLCRAGLARQVTLESTADPFIAWLKRRVIEGFYTSQQGLQELNYKGNSFYSISPGCDVPKE